MNKLKNILLAEDDLDDYLFFVEAFERISADYKISRAANGLECLNYLKTKECPDIIFLDLNMPIRNGLDCLKFIRQKEELSDVPVIIYSTSHYIKDIDTAYKNGANCYIVKPSSGTELSEILHIALLQLSENWQQPAKDYFVLRKRETSR